MCIRDRVGYRLKNTVTDNGHVARGICELNEKKELVKVTERTRIEKRGDGIAYSEDDGETWVDVDGDTLVSMNMWGFTRDVYKRQARYAPDTVGQ